MKNETKAVESVTPDGLMPIDMLKAKYNTPEYVYIGVCTKMNWKSEKAVAEKEYQDAVEAFLKSPMNGGKKTC